MFLYLLHPESLTPREEASTPAMLFTFQSLAPWLLHPSSVIQI
jgi:hypothetical protein